MRLRLLVIGGFTLWVAAVAAQAPRAPADHPATPSGSRNDPSTLTERIRPSTSARPTTPIARRNLIDTFIFGKMEADHIAHAPLASDE